MLARNSSRFRTSTEAKQGSRAYGRPMRKLSMPLVLLAFAAPTTASASTLSVGPATVLDSKVREISITTTGSGIFALPQDRARGVLRRYEPTTLAPTAGWPSPFVIKGRTTGFAFQKSFVAATPSGDVVVLDPNRGRLTEVDGKIGKRRWQVSTNRIDKRGYRLAAGDLAVDADGKIYVHDNERGGLVRFSRRGRYEGVRRLSSKALIRRIAMRDGRVALLAGGSSGGAATLALAGTAGSKAPRTVTTVGAGPGESVVDVALDSKGRPRVLISTTAQKRIETLDPFTGAIVDTATLPSATTARPTFFELDARDRPVVADGYRLTIYDVTGAP